jgi:hypothetical protein
MSNKSNKSIPSAYKEAENNQNNYRNQVFNNGRNNRGGQY